MKESAFRAADILLPEQIDMTKWSVVACDQYTGQPDYWDAVNALVGDAPSTLRLTLPEIYLEEPDVQERIERINATMIAYEQANLFRRYPHSFIYTERTLRDGSVRCGVVGAVDLRQYDFEKGSQSPVRATEATVAERIPPRVKIREHAALELPHVMLLIDDPEKKVIEPLKTAALKKVYDFDLMQNSGHVRGYLVDGEAAEALQARLDELSDPARFEKMYGISDRGVLAFAVGDGNHSLATAKTCDKNHPTEKSRYALAEVVNLHSDALSFEPIHRVVFDVDAAALLSALRSELDADERADRQSVTVVCGKKEQTLYFHRTTSQLSVGTLQAFLDAWLKANGGKIDYIHGDDVVRSLCEKEHTVGFLLDGMKKEELFSTVILDGALPRKTFSMGHACDKRFYLEAREIR